MKKALLTTLLLAGIAIGVRPLIIASPFNKSIKTTVSNLVTENRDVKGFSKIEASGAFEIRIIKSNTFMVKVEADEKIIKNVITEVSGDKLVIRMSNESKKNYGNENRGQQITIQMPNLNALTCSGAVEIQSDDIFEAENSN